MEDANEETNIFDYDNEEEVDVLYFTSIVPFCFRKIIFKKLSLLNIL